MRPLLPLLATTTLAVAAPATAETPPTAFQQPVLITFDAPNDTPTASLSTQSRPTLSSSANWTGFYIGGQLGVGVVDSDISSNDEDFIGGVTFGYDHDFGRWVLGGALDYDFADINAGPGTSIEEIFRVKLRGGPKIGNGLLYGAAGWANADTDTAGRDDGWFIGAGYEYLVSSQFSVGGEVLYHEFDNFNSTGIDVEATTIQVRATFRF
ncbi:MULTISPECIES: outer membrane protein [unclassified Roseovarius]|jgi:outer membrane immunogenic protein|uniref:outer membrane protein n=1 Tax=unclassified Roseovarius TaxID=2614913 RepID=UPI0000684DCD|nr:MULTISPECIES: porin family protein [unclassified Roseovarius]EAQ25512.1 possible outer membrane protein [Roseovarius sp. 217]KJS44595.1 MAG: membrane protein [Roseovarius sp. BRH_c41]